MGNSATDGILAYLGRKGRKTGAEKLRNASPTRLKDLTALNPVFPAGLYFAKSGAYGLHFSFVQ